LHCTALSLLASKLQSSSAYRFNMATTMQNPPNATYEHLPLEAVKLTCLSRQRLRQKPRRAHQTRRAQSCPHRNLLRVRHHHRPRCQNQPQSKRPSLHRLRRPERSRPRHRGGERLRALRQADEAGLCENSLGRHGAAGGRRGGAGTVEADAIGGEGEETGA